MVNIYDESVSPRVRMIELRQEIEELQKSIDELNKGYEFMKAERDRVQKAMGCVLERIDWQHPNFTYIITDVDFKQLKEALND